MACGSICGHGNLFEECAQCDSDARLGVDSSILDQVPDCEEQLDSEYEDWLDYVERDDPDGGLEDNYQAAFPIDEGFPSESDLT